MAPSGDPALSGIDGESIFGMRKYPTPATTSMMADSSAISALTAGGPCCLTAGPTFDLDDELRELR